MTRNSTFVNQKFILVLCLFSNSMKEPLFLPLVRIFLFLIFWVLAVAGKAQSIDSLPAGDSLRRTDSVRIDSSTIIAPVKKDTIRISEIVYRTGSVKE